MPRTYLYIVIYSGRVAAGAGTIPTAIKKTDGRHCVGKCSACRQCVLDVGLCRALAAGRNDAVPENENIGLLWAKHRNFRGKSTALSIKEVRCFQFPENALFLGVGGCGKGGCSKLQSDSDRKGRGIAYSFAVDRCQHKFPFCAVFAPIHVFCSILPHIKATYQAGTWHFGHCHRVVGIM